MSSSPIATNPRVAPPVPRAPIPLIALGRAALHDPQGRITLVGALASLALLVVMFLSNILHFIFVWTTDENYSHGFLVPLIGLFFANQAIKILMPEKLRTYVSYMM